MENNNETNKTETPTITDEDVINYITQQKEASKEKYKVTEIDENTKSIQLDKEVAKDFIDTIKFNKGLTDEIIKEEEELKQQEDAGRIKVSKDAAFNFNALYTEKLNKQLDKVTLSETEKDAYVSSLFSDVPLVLDISYDKLKLVFTFRSKYIYEQEYIAKFIKSMFTSESGKSMTPDEMCIFIFKVNVSVILQKLNDKNFFKDTQELCASPEHRLSYDEFVKIINLRLEQLSNLNQQLWSMIINAACVFEKKEQLLAEFAVNEDF